MQFEWNGDRYRLWFVHERHWPSVSLEHEGGGGSFRITHTTACEIQRYEPDRSLDWLEREFPPWRSVAIGEAYCSVLDMYSKEKGRQIALRRAVDEMSEDDKDLRRTIFNSYFNRSRGDHES